MSAADDSAVAATNCRRDSFVRDIGLPSLLSEIILPPSDPASKVCAKVRRFRPRDQSRIDGGCRENDGDRNLELTLCSNSRQSAVPALQYCGAHTSLRSELDWVRNSAAHVFQCDLTGSRRNALSKHLPVP